jgi:GNAT superfamily N-acetyltransferase
MYVVAPARRRGVARSLLAELERRAAEFGYSLIQLETGNRQPEAIALYESCGYHRIPPYGSHVGDPVSVCFQKETGAR